MELETIHVVGTDTFELSDFEVQGGYFVGRLSEYEERYRKEYPTGWGAFYADYSHGLTDKANLDYDEWAFLCEHFMAESWTPPEYSTSICPERPEMISGFSFGGNWYCLIRKSTLTAWHDC